MSEQKGFSPVQEQRLTPEDLLRSDADLRTLSLLQNYFAETPYSFVLSGGYAVEAYKGGTLSRPHHDMDALIFLPDIVVRDHVEEAVYDKLENDDTWWTRYRITDDDLQYQEVSKTKSDKEKRFIEIGFESDESFYTTSQRILRDSQGKEFEFTVLGLSDLVAGKVRMANRLSSMNTQERQEEGYRDLSRHDREDFYALLNHPDFQKEDVFKNLVYFAPEEVRDNDVDEYAEVQWDTALKLFSRDNFTGGQTK